jgi:hypothetical protein
MEKPDFEKAGDEVVEIERLPPVSIEISLLEILGLITLIQVVVIQNPGIEDDKWAKIGVEAARQLQSRNLFSQYPEICKVLEFGWNPEQHQVTPETIAAMLLNIDSRQSEGSKISESGETVAQQIARSILKSPGYLDI